MYVILQQYGFSPSEIPVAAVKQEMERTEMDKETRLDLKKLKEKRGSIDLLDEKLLKLLNQRVRITTEIGKIKKEIGKKIHDSKREKEVLGGLRRKNRGPLKEKDLKKIFTTIMKACRNSQT